MFDEADRHAVLKLARDAVIAQVTGGAPPEVPPTDLFARRAGAFVTLNEHGDLRGCIGYPEADRPLGDVVIGAAVSASTADPRFPPVRPEELPHLQIEVSVLSVIEPVSDPEEIEPGRHGLVVQLGRRRGLLLPQVATEWRWDRKTFIEQTCVKAGLPRDAWKHGAQLFRFEAEVFGETKRD